MTHPPAKELFDTVEIDGECTICGTETTNIVEEGREEDFDHLCDQYECLDEYMETHAEL